MKKWFRLTLLTLAAATSSVRSFLLESRLLLEHPPPQTHPRSLLAEKSRRRRWLGRRQIIITIPSLSSRDGESLTVKNENAVEDTTTIGVSTTRTIQEQQSLLDDEPASTDAVLPGLGLLVLCSVPLVWGTYVPIVRLLYEIDPPIPGFLFSAFYFFISAVTTVVLANVLEERNKQQQEESFVVENASNQTKAEFLAVLELGSWLFMGNTLQLLGLKTVSSDRAGFLVQRKLLWLS